MEGAPPHIIMLPTMGMGHMIPMAEFSRKLLNLRSDLAITFIIPGDAASATETQKSLLRTLPGVNTVFLTPEGGGGDDDSTETESLEAKIVTGVIRSIAPLRRLLVELLESSPQSVFVVDTFGSFTVDVVKELRIPAYMFFPSPAVALAVGFHFLEHATSLDCDFRDLPGPVKIPGFKPFHWSDLPDSVQDRRTKSYEMMTVMMQKYTLADGIVVNSFLELEPDVFRGLRRGNIPPAYGVGPMVRSGSAALPDAEEAECLKWLDSQAANSVLFVSFGSGGTLSSRQLTELAVGLESSGQNFIFVARKPNDGDKSAAYFQTDTAAARLDYLPDGFAERTKERGFVLRDWAPQIEILRHAAVGGFLTHCGWNSTLESIVHGVPLISWPLFAEQKVNAVMLSEVLQVALRVKENEDGLVESHQIESLVRRLIKEEEGQVLRERMRKLQLAAAAAEDGSSTATLASLAREWKVI